MKQFPSKYAKREQDSTGYSFIRAYNIWHRKIKRELVSIGVTHPQFVVLATIGSLQQHNKEIKQIDIANGSDIDVMTVSTILRKLVSLSFVERVDAKTDTRAKAVVLTKKGSVILQQGLKIVEDIDEAFFGVLPDVANFNQQLTKLMEGEANV